jgi:hypothetical protein
MAFACPGTDSGANGGFPLLRNVDSGSPGRPPRSNAALDTCPPHAHASFPSACVTTKFACLLRRNENRRCFDQKVPTAASNRSTSDFTGTIPEGLVSLVLHCVAVRGQRFTEGIAQGPKVPTWAPCAEPGSCGCAQARGRSTLVRPPLAHGNQATPR